MRGLRMWTPNLTFIKVTSSREGCRASAIRIFLSNLSEKCFTSNSFILTKLGRHSTNVSMNEAHDFLAS
ncbi:hypothetical protein CPB84DRAFT_1775331 [Gymnopilus junonius]|uniref:Uncharacterized protein n=1 Tax=Gymnopilus junonius TaxID=109634 RepID=A0A9P5NS47_GYMJU|nr:hypothetical protein CPB84DRAFT_1775331 [Gymnopilus junonius]